MAALADPHNLLAKVQPDLVRLLLLAEQLPQRWVVVQGARSEDDQRKACASGHSQTMHSRHIVCGDGFARAVDVAAVDTAGKLTWAEGHEAEVFGQISKQILVSAVLRGVPLQWGGSSVGAWEPGVPNHFYDWGHFQLPWAQYPG